MRKSGVRCLVMGGQACISYGAAEFSRDLDLAVRSDPGNLANLEASLVELQAECIAVPPFERVYLEMGLAVHFRCRHPEAAGLRVDIMSKMRGVEPFEKLWERRTTLVGEDESIELLSLPDLVRAKKTQRDKDWPMIARLVESSYFRHVQSPTPEQIVFWLGELRTPSLLIEAVQRFPAEAAAAAPSRRLLRWAVAGDETDLEHALREEEKAERAADREYWLPLKRELERLRRAARH